MRKSIVPDTFRRAVGVLNGQDPSLTKDVEEYIALVSLHEQTSGRSEDLDRHVEKVGLDLAIRLLDAVTYI